MPPVYAIFGLILSFAIKKTCTDIKEQKNTTACHSHFGWKIARVMVIMTILLPPPMMVPISRCRLKVRKPPTVLSNTVTTDTPEDRKKKKHLYI